MKVKWLAIAITTVLIAHSQIAWAEEPVVPEEQVVEEGGNLTLGTPTGPQTTPGQPQSQMSKNPPPSIPQPPTPPAETPQNPPGADSTEGLPQGWKRY